ncbi:ESPR domain-containing protein [uncultured Herbaspirillum sp.]
MNQLCYRIIFNKTRGQFMAVAENSLGLIYGDARACAAYICEEERVPFC